MGARIFSILFWLLLAGGLVWAGREGLKWMRAHPEEFSFAPLKLDHRVGSATRGKLSALGQDRNACHALLGEAGINFTALPPRGEGKCHASDLTRLPQQPAFPVRIHPGNSNPSCAVNAALILWQREVAGPAAAAHFGSKVARLETFGSYNCRTVANSERMSEHATGNAVDIAALVLADGRRISVLGDWNSDDPARRAFLRDIREGACRLFTTVLSPDYNEAHADHFHFDMAQRTGGYGVCR